MPFEDYKLPLAEHYHEFLTQMFGDYMKLPPIEQRQGSHLISVDFGKYSYRPNVILIYCQQIEIFYLYRYIL